MRGDMNDLNELRASWDATPLSRRVEILVEELGQSDPGILMLFPDGAILELLAELGEISRSHSSERIFGGLNAQDAKKSLGRISAAIAGAKVGRPVSAFGRGSKSSTRAREARRLAAALGGKRKDRTRAADVVAKNHAVSRETVLKDLQKAKKRGL
jgi:hypothetical protein